MTQLVHCNAIHSFNTKCPSEVRSREVGPFNVLARTASPLKYNFKLLLQCEVHAHYHVSLPHLPSFCTP